jgi:hypothetical protein
MRFRKGESQGLKRPASSLHLKVECASLDLKAILTLAFVIRLFGFFVIDVCGAFVSGFLHGFSVGAVELFRGVAGPTAKSVAESSVSSPASSRVGQPGAIVRLMLDPAAS